ncbi:Na+/H+ antiporter NhaA [Sphaerisporangium rhizosphaerae]|uniref:Na+/H+ antiporter NhaA n=1 Tax=Sphaerisporangium rhizosphaerae TaxID=2269375 RepID=A0ABW2P1D1_9ACTN
MELKREFVAGDLRDPRRAAVPVAAAFGGAAVPAVLYLVALVPPTARGRRTGCRRTGGGRGRDGWRRSRGWTGR